MESSGGPGWSPPNGASELAAEAEGRGKRGTAALPIVSSLAVTPARLHRSTTRVRCVGGELPYRAAEAKRPAGGLSLSRPPSTLTMTTPVSTAPRSSEARTTFSVLGLHHRPGRGTFHGRRQSELAWHMLIWNKRSAGLGCWLRAVRAQAVTGSGLGDGNVLDTASFHFRHDGAANERMS